MAARHGYYQREWAAGSDEIGMEAINPTYGIGAVASRRAYRVGDRGVEDLSAPSAWDRAPVGVTAGEVVEESSERRRYATRGFVQISPAGNNTPWSAPDERGQPSARRTLADTTRDTPRVRVGAPYMLGSVLGDVVEEDGSAVGGHQGGWKADDGDNGSEHGLPPRMVRRP